jgi:hypothetical protein
MTGVPLQDGRFESLLWSALAPVDPPESLSLRLEQTLTTISDLAGEELESWELSTMRDPRNWARPAAAVAVSGVAGIALVILQARNRQKARVQASKDPLDFVEQAARALADEGRRLLDR